jgi:hypothetical protein
LSYRRSDNARDNKLNYYHMRGVLKYETTIVGDLEPPQTADILTVELYKVLQAIDDFAAELAKEAEKIPKVCLDSTCPFDYEDVVKPETIEKLTRGCPKICPSYRGGE